MAVTLYDVLGVTAAADSEEIETAYRERVKECHPDLSDHPQAEARFKWVVRAEAVLADPTERRRYDRLGHAAYCDAEGWDDGASTADSRSSDDETAATRQGATAAASAPDEESAGEPQGEADETTFDAAADASGNVDGHQAAERAWEAQETGTTEATDNRGERATEDGGVNRGGERKRVHEGVYRSGGDGYVGGVRNETDTDDSPFTRNWQRAARANEGVRTATAFYLQTLGTPLVFVFALLYVLVAQRMIGLLAATGIYDSVFSLVVVSLTAALVLVGGIAHVVARVLATV
jgi:curved DNA-binding protein CbpA